MHFLLEKDDWKKCKKNNVAIALNVLYVKKEKIYPAYLSKHNSNREKQVIILMISNGEKLWHHLAVKKNISIMKMNHIKKIMIIFIV